MMPRTLCWRLGWGDTRDVSIQTFGGWLWERRWWRFWWRRPINPMPWRLERWALRRLGARRAQRELRRGDATIVAADALEQLNRHAKAHLDYWREHERHEVYRLKYLLLRELYREHEATVTPCVQVLKCRACTGTGIWRSGNGRYEDVCERCRGTGIYREHRLVLLAFTLGGRRYAWHQPADLWPELQVVFEYATPEPYTAPATPRRALDRLTYETLAETVAQFVRAQGLGSDVWLDVWFRPPVDPFRVALRDDLRQLRADVASRARRAGRRLTAVLTRTPQEDDDLPF